MEKHNSSLPQKSNGRLILLAIFENRVEAMECKETISSLFEQINLAVARVFETNGGQALLEDVASVYKDYGLSNDTGWDQHMPILQRGKDVIWPLPDGVICEEAADLVSTMEPLGIEIHDVGHHVAPWESCHPPEMKGVFFESEADDELDVEDDFAALSTLQQKRILH